jgi:hypothetical protein
LCLGAALLLIVVAVAIPAAEPGAMRFGDVTGVEHVAFVRASVPGGLVGPAKECAPGDRRDTRACVAPDGAIWMPDSLDGVVYRIKDGQARIVAGCGLKGFRDGPADRAMFDFGVGSYCDCEANADAAGNVYVSDMMNDRLRRILQKPDGAWWVETVSGGPGKGRTPKKGEWTPASELRFGGAARLAVAADGTIYYAQYDGIYMVRNGQGTRLATAEELKEALGPKRSVNDWHVGGSHITPDGVFYWMPGGQEIFRFDTRTGQAEVVAGDGLALDIEDPAKIAKARPAGPTWLGDKYYWWQHLASRTTPAIASDGKRCLVAYMREYPFAECGRPAVTACLLDPGDPKAGEPVKVTGGPSPAWTGKGWALGGPVWKEGWTPTPMLGAGYLPEGMSLAPASQPRAKAENPSATIDVVAAFGGGYNVGKGSTASFPSAAAFNGKHTLVAMHYAWRPKQGQGPVFAILLARVETDNALKVLNAQPLVAATATNPAAVNAPALAPGPGGECLLVYEDDAETARCRVAAQIVRP